MNRDNSYIVRQHRQVSTSPAASRNHSLTRIHKQQNDVPRQRRLGQSTIDDVFRLRAPYGNKWQIFFLDVTQIAE